MDRKSNFALFLFCPIALAILLLPMVSSTCLAKNITLGWDANPEPDLEGYIIYRNEGSPGPPYKFSSTLPEDDLSNPLIPVVTLSGLKQNTEYYIAVTAYDTEGNESYFSDQVCVEIIDSLIENCSVSLASSNSSGGGGSGSTCFIDSVARDFTYFPVLLGAFIIMGLVVRIKRKFQIRRPKKVQACKL